MTTDGQGVGQGLPEAGWYPDAANPGRERLWTGERWVEWIRPAKLGRVEETPAGWYPDTGHPGFERLWSGEMWTEEIRRIGAPRQAPVAPTPAAVGSPAATTPLGAQQPQAAGTGVPPAPLQPVPRPKLTYRDENPPYRLGGLGLLTMGLLALAIAAAVAQLIANQIYIGVEGKIIAGKFPSFQHIESVTHGVHVTHTISFVVDVLVAIPFVTWFYRAYRNLVRVGIEDLRFGPGWAIGGWFIPIFSFVRQKQIANDIWRASASAATIGLPRRRELPLPAILNWWWGVWIASGLLIAIGNSSVSRANSNSIFTSHSLSNERTGIWITQIGLLAAIAAALLAILVVREVTRLQDDNFEARVPGTF